MEEQHNSAPVEEIKCKCCKTKAIANDLYCTNCGFPLQGTEEEQGNFIGQYITRKNEEEEWKKQVGSAKTTLIVVAILTVIVSLVYLAILGSEGIALVIISFILACIYFFLAWWSAKNPFGAILTGLIIYVSLIIINGFMDPPSLLRGWIIKIVVISYMVNGVRGAAKVRNLN